jgi:phage baseplate assembly protein gpV
MSVSHTPAKTVKQYQPNDMSITISDPQANQQVGQSFSASGSYSGASGTPTITCYLTPSDQSAIPNTQIQAQYVTFANGTWQAYFSNVAAGDYTITVQMTSGSTQVNYQSSVVVTSSPPATITSPTAGSTIGSGTTCPVQGTVSPSYVIGYEILCCLMINGVKVVNPVSATINLLGTWQANLPISSGLSGNTNANLNMALVTAASPPTTIIESSVGSLTIS